MKRIGCLAFLAVLAMGAFQSGPARAGVNDFLEGLKGTLGLGKELSTSDIAAGLKEALRIGTGNAVERVSQTGGYLNNPGIRIPMPKSIQKVEKILRLAGLGSYLDDFEMSMNRAAEAAAPEAKAVFWDAIKQMRIADARKILDGRENEATLYFKDKTYDRLHELFKPMVHQAMSKVGVTHQYQTLEERAQSLPLAGDLGLDLDKYVTEGALDGLFHMLAEEEKKIRQDPAARVTDLLKKVFGRS